MAKMADAHALELALEFADYHDEFDSSFLVSLGEAMERYGRLSLKQSNALHNIVEKWRMVEWAEENL
jgi:hypothetical protein